MNVSIRSLKSQVAGCLEKLEQEMHPTGKIAELIDRLEVERNELDSRVHQLEIEVNRLRRERELLLGALAHPHISEEELEQTCNEDGGVSLAEIMAKVNRVGVERRLLVQAMSEQDLTPEAIARRKLETGGMTLSEFWNKRHGQ